MTTLIVWTTIGLSASFLWCLVVGLFLAVGKGR